MKPFIALESATVAYAEDRPLFNPLTQCFVSGDIWQLSGPNGVGKTTLLKALLGEHALLSGRVQKEGSALFWRDALGVHPRLTVQENLLFTEKLLHPSCKKHTWEEKAIALGLQEKWDVRASSLSTGQKRRLSFACFLMLQAPIWLLDEPFWGWDQAGKSLLIYYMTKHAEKGGLVLFASHESHRVTNAHHLTLEACA